jgi:drug/metabolite transporter (DMT)-like permease
LDGRVHLVLIFVQLTFAGFHVFGKLVLGEVEPLALAGIRVAVGAPVLLALAWWADRVRPPLREWPGLFFLGLCGVAANQLLFVIGLGYTTATSASILMPSIPVFSAALAGLLGVERLTAPRALGILSAALGALVLLDVTRLELGGRAALGNLLILLNCLAYSAFVVLQRPVLERIPPLTLTAWAYAGGSLLVLPVALPALSRVQPLQLSASALLGLAYIVLVPTILNYALVTWANRRSSPALVSTYVTLQPVAASALAAALLGERLEGRQLLGFLAIALGLALVSAGDRWGRALGLARGRIG